MAKKMDDQTLKGILSQEIRSAYGWAGTDLSADREKSLDYYMGRPFGNEIAGRSSVVSRDVADTIEWMLPSLLRIFTSADDVVRFEPRQAEDEETAQQATDFVNWIFTQENSGFLIMYTWFKDALLQKLGVLKAVWESEEKTTVEKYEGLTDDELELLVSDDEYAEGSRLEVLEHSSYPAPGQPEAPAPMPAMLPPPGPMPMQGGAPMMGGPMPPDPMMAGAPLGMMPGMMPPVQPLPPMSMLHDVKIRITKSYGCAKIYTVPPEEFLVARRARDLATSPFTGHRVKKTVSDLVAQGYDEDVVNDLPDWADSMSSLEAQSRHPDQAPHNDESLDPTMREVAVTECYILVDYDGDGIAEMRKITIGGDGDGASEILDNEPCDTHPFAGICPIMMPHEVYGLSMADLVMDLQLIKSTIMRQMLDGLYLANNPRMLAVDGDANLDDLLTSRPGGIVRAKSINGVRELTTTWVGVQAFPMLEYVDGMREGRTGISKAFQGLDANALNNQTATAYAQMTSAAQSRVELIARIFAETGVKRVFQLILGLVTKHQNKGRIIRLRGKYVEMDPRNWSSEMDTSITVGLGTGNKDQQLMHLGMIAQKQEQILMTAGPDNPLVGLAELYTTYTKLVENAGLKGAEQYFKDPGKAAAGPPQPPKPDPKMLEAQAKLQMQQQEGAARLQLEQQQAAAKLQADQATAAQKLQLEQERAVADIAMQRARMEAEIGLARERMAAEMMLEREKLAMERESKREEMQMRLAIETAPKVTIGIGAVPVMEGPEPFAEPGEMMEPDPMQPGLPL